MADVSIFDMLVNECVKVVQYCCLFFVSLLEL